MFNPLLFNKMDGVVVLVVGYGDRKKVFFLNVYFSQLKLSRQRAPVLDLKSTDYICCTINWNFCHQCVVSE